jgi:hypothetical protein
MVIAATVHRRLQPVHDEWDVLLRRLELGVPERGLHVTEMRAVEEHVRRHSVPIAVCAYAIFGAAFTPAASIQPDTSREIEPGLLGVWCRWCGVRWLSPISLVSCGLVVYAVSYFGSYFETWFVRRARAGWSSSLGGIIHEGDIRARFVSWRVVSCLRVTDGSEHNLFAARHGPLADEGAVRQFPTSVG